METHLPPRPSWLKVKNKLSNEYLQMQKDLADSGLNTVCTEASCPNSAECWSRKTATIMILGKVCTRGCRFCQVDTGKPGGIIDPSEIERTSKMVGLLGLRYLVVTSVDRDDLEDGGAGFFGEVVQRIKHDHPSVLVECLIPDFGGKETSMKTFAASRPFVIAHNLETVERLSPMVRDRRASYKLSLKCLEYYKKNYPEIKTKSSLMLGMGEMKDEILQTMDDLRACGTDILTLGQYLSPSHKHWPVDRYVTPDEFEQFKTIALNKGFLKVFSGVFVRSSYHAEDALSADT